MKPARSAETQDSMPTRSPLASPRAPRHVRLLSVGLIVSVAAIVLGARWSVIDRFGIDLPQWDQWDAEGLHLLLPWLQGRPILAELFAPHNEHYVVLTKLLNVGITLLNGQWDQRVECAVNALLPALLAGALLRFSQSFLRRAFWPAFGIILAAVWSLPLAWQNVIAGFHSQQFLLLLLAFATISWLPFTRPGSGRWWLGALAAVASLMTMASGLLASVVVVALLVTRWTRPSPNRSTPWLTAAIAVAVIAVGWFTRHEVEYHATMRAANARDFLVTALQALQWPTASRWCALVLWLPWLALTAALWDRRRRSESEDPLHTSGWILSGLGGWVLLQIAATAYARGAGGQPPAARYADTLLFGLMVNLLALGWLEAKVRLSSSTGRAALSEESHPTRRVGSNLALTACAATWLLFFFVGATRVSRTALGDELPSVRDGQKRAVVRTRAYLVTRDSAYLNDPEIPYPGANACAARLGQPEFLPFFPVSVRPAIGLSAERNTGFEPATNARPLPPGYSGPFGVIPGVTIERTDDLPPLFHTTWTSYRSRHDVEPRVWISASVPTPALGGWLLIPLAGSASATLELVATSSGEVLATLHPSTGDRWHATPLRAPNEAFFLRARCQAVGEWLGFGEPIAISMISFLAWQLCLRGSVLTWTGALALLACAGGMWLGRRTRSETDTPAGDGTPRLDEGFYRGKSWGSVPISAARDLPSLKLHHLSRLLARRSQPDARLLEVGCGSGRILATIHERNPALRLTGIDLSAEQIALASRTHPEIEFVCGNGEALPFPDASFDHVVFFDYLEHIERPQQSLAEMYRVLKPGGHLHFVCPAERQSIYGLSSRIFGRHFKEHTAGHIQQFSRKELAALTEQSGFRVMERHYSYHFLGSLMDYALFTLMLHPRIYAIYWSSNPYYATNATSARRGFFPALLRFGNTVAYYESKLLSGWAFSATAVHLTAAKPK